MTLGAVPLTLFEREYPLPVALHAYDYPAVLLRFVVQRLSKRTDLRDRESLGRSVGIFAYGIVVQHQQRQPGAVAGLGVFQHLPVAGRVAERDDRVATDHHMNAFRLARIIVVQKELGLLGEERFAGLVVAVLRLAHAAHHLLGRDAIHPLGVDADKVLPAAGDDVGPETAR